jgi:hypothetical protein
LFFHPLIVKTFDGLKYDCQGEGDHILVKSTATQREVQARYEHLAANKAISVGKGVVIQDEGDTPKVQISYATLEDSVGNILDGGCVLQFFVDDEQRDLLNGSGDDRVVVEMQDGKISVRYTESEMEVTVQTFKCRMNICVLLPDTDPTVGILGTPNGNVNDEWTTLDGDIIELPESRANKLRKPGYDFCTGHFCIRDEEKSLFIYPEKDEGIDFDYYQKCNLPYGTTMDKYFENTPQWILDICRTDIACIMDVMEGDEDDARQLRKVNMLYAQTCNPPGGECDDSKCCGDVKCVDSGGLAGKVCDGDMTVSYCILFCWIMFTWRTKCLLTTCVLSSLYSALPNLAIA